MALDLGGMVDKLGGLAKNLSNLGGLAEKLGGENIIESLKEAIQKKDYQMVENTARSLGDAASEVGLDDLSKLSGEVVSAVKEKRFGDLNGLLEKVKKEYDVIAAKLSEAKK